VKQGKTDEEFWLGFAKEKGIALSVDWVDSLKAVMKEAIGVNSQMYALVEELRERQIPIALLSNIDERLSKLIREFGLYAPFNPCLLSCEIGVEKPDPKAYECLLTNLNLPAQEILFIDDRLENVEAARKMGIDALLFESLQQLRQELIKRQLLDAKTEVSMNVQNLLQEYVEDNGTPGAAVALIDHNKVQSSVAVRWC
jgi:HAD superfamily hydrolase (TIGR01509 family)